MNTSIPDEHWMGLALEQARLAAAAGEVVCTIRRMACCPDCCLTCTKVVKVRLVERKGR